MFRLKQKEKVQPPPMADETVFTTLERDSFSSAMGNGGLGKPAEVIAKVTDYPY